MLKLGNYTDTAHFPCFHFHFLGDRYLLLLLQELRRPGDSAAAIPCCVRYREQESGFPGANWVYIMLLVSLLA